MREPLPASLVIRPATDADADVVLACLAEAFEPFRGNYSRQGFEDSALTAGTIHARLREMDVFVAEADGRTIGTIATCVIPPDEGHLRGMAVVPEWQGRGIADKLLEFAEVRLQSQKCSRVTLDTTSPLQRAIRFYEKHGYRATGNIGNHFGMPLYEYAKKL
jgi:ribosomal protein S18 acetylase RimI-like enzyme